MLDKLGVAVETPSSSAYANPVITRKACEQAGVSFEYFQSFAKLIQPSDAYQTRMNWGARYFETRDRQLDRIETMRLVNTLWTLDTKNGSLQSYTIDFKNISFQNTDQVKSRVNLLGANPCWLGAESLHMGLLASLGDNFVHEMTWMTSVDGKSTFRTATQPFEFACKYLPELEPFAHALSYDPKQMPSEIQRAANSTVSLAVEGQMQGSGAVVLYPGYILTARHVIGDTPNNKVTVTVEIAQGKGISTKTVVADVMDLPASDGQRPDLVLLYVGRDISTPAPLQFSEAVQPGQDIFLLGIPGQQSPDNTLVQTGIVDVREDEHASYSRTTAIGLPGDSGGPVVDSAGNIAGITKAAAMDGEDAEGNYSKKTRWSQGSKIETAEITGSYMYRMDFFGPTIRSVIEEDRKRRAEKRK